MSQIGGDSRSTNQGQLNVRLKPRAERPQVEQVMQAIRESTFGDMKSLVTLLRIRGTALRIRDTGEFLQNKRILDAFAASGYVTGGSEHEVLMCGGANVRAMRPLQVRTL